MLFRSARLLLPPLDDCLVKLLCREVTITPSAYITYVETDEFIEVALSPQDSTTIRLLAKAFECGPALFLGYLADAFRTAWPDSSAQCRFSSIIRSGQGKHTFQNVDQDDDRAPVNLLLATRSLLAARRVARTVTLSLGIGAQRPVRFVVSIPAVPAWALHRLVKACPQPSVRALSMLEGSKASWPNLVLGPLPKDWSGCARDRSRQHAVATRVTQELSSRLHTKPEFLSRPGQGPFAVYLPYANPETASCALHAMRTEPLLEDLFSARPAHLFETSLPPECVEVLGEKGLQEHLRASGVGPPAPP